MAGALRLSEAVGGLSLACDAANGNRPGKVLRTATLAVAIGARHGLAAGVLRDTYYVNLLRYLGCTAFAHEEAHVYGGGDDIGVRRTMALVDAADPGASVARVLRGILQSGPLVDSARAVSRLLGDGVAVSLHASAQCDVSVRMAELLQLGPGVTAALRQICERWDGRGAPRGEGGEALEVAIRLHHLADVIDLVATERGGDAALAEARKRRGRHFDPALTDTLLASPELLELVDGDGTWERFLAAEPEPLVMADPGRIDDVARAFAGFADLRSTYTLGHSTGVAALAVRAAELLGATDEERRDLRRAALLHDVGRVAVPGGIWDKPAKLGVAEWEQVRLHAYYTERALFRAPALRPLAAIAGAAHERLDGEGYHRSLPAAMLPILPRVLAAADAYHAMREPRPHRPAHETEPARRQLLDEVRRGRLDGDAARAVLEAAEGQRPRAPAAWPCGLSDREVEVLRLLARGGTNKEIGAALGISAKTEQHHVAHVYEKIGVQSRAAAALFATDRGLLMMD